MISANVEIRINMQLHSRVNVRRDASGAHPGLGEQLLRVPPGPVAGRVPVGKELKDENMSLNMTVFKSHTNLTVCVA